MRKHAEACTRSAIAAGDRGMQVYGLQAQLMVAAYQGDDDLYERADRALMEIGAERPARNIMWLRFSKVLREAGRGNITLATSIVKNLEFEKLGPAERAFADAIHALLIASRHRDEAIAFLSRPVLLVAEKDYESRRILAHAQVFHALAQWLVGRGRAARRAPTPDLSAVTPPDAALLTVISTICSTSRQTTTARQLAQLTEPLLALQMDGHARFFEVCIGAGDCLKSDAKRARSSAGSKAGRYDLRRCGSTRSLEPHCPYPSKICLLQDWLLWKGRGCGICGRHGLDRVALVTTYPDLGR